MTLIGGGPLYYYDTAGYLIQGRGILSTVGLAEPAPNPPAGAAPAPVDSAAPGPDTAVAGNRAAIYSLIVGLFARAGWLQGMVLVNLGAILLAVWLTMRNLAREIPAPPPAPALTALGLTVPALVAGCLGSLPFYVAFLMPDIFTPVLLLAIANLCIFAPTMPGRERAANAALALLAILTHSSHLLIAVLLLPLGLFLSPMLARRRRWVAGGLIGLLIGAGVAERVGFAYVAEHFQHRKVAYPPFLTARLIDDGPGLRYLQSRCPDPALATCALYAALARSDDPRRLDAPNIIFSHDPATGSLKLLPDADQQRIAGEQLGFAADVVRAHPFAVAAAFAENVATQLGYFSISMTVPRPDMLAAPNPMAGVIPDALTTGRLVTSGRGWIAPLTWAHGIVYGVSLLGVLALLIRPGGLSSRTRRFALLILLGLLANAVVCAGISEPAHRYGARVAFLLPMLAVALALIRRAGRAAP